MVRPGLAWLGEAWHGMARQGQAGRGTWKGVAWFGRLIERGQANGQVCEGK